jgi:hypothetical protein
MDNYTTFETSVKLQGKGFPQPDFKFGQLWYETERQDFAIVGTAKFELFKQHGNGSLVFAPTPADILLELPDKVLFWKVGNIFVCGVQMESKEGRGVIEFEAIFKHGNPAEACALAYLAK